MCKFFQAILITACFSSISFGGPNSWIDLDLGEIGTKAYYGDVSGDIAVYAVGPACDYTWNLKYKDLNTGKESKASEIHQSGIDTKPRIDGDIIVWCGGPVWKNPWTHEPSNFSVFARNIATGKQKTLRKYTMGESYSHPAVSGNKVVWIEHTDLDPTPKGREAKNWWNTSYNICGADITDIENPVYFTIAKNVGTRDPYPCMTYWKSYDGVIDISGETVVWQAEGDIFGANISDTKNIARFNICKEKGIQCNPVISGETVVWTDQRNDDGDIYGASILNMRKIQPVAIIKESGTQKQPAIDGDMIAYVNESKRGNPRTAPEIALCKISGELKAGKIKLPKTYKGLSPSIHKNTIIWQGIENQRGKAIGIKQIIPKTSNTKN